MITTIFGISTEAILGWTMIGLIAFAFLLVPLYTIRELKRIKKMQAYLIGLMLGRAQAPPPEEQSGVTSLTKWRKRAGL